jgi:hypothetical protein
MQPATPWGYWTLAPRDHWAPTSWPLNACCHSHVVLCPWAVMHVASTCFTIINQIPRPSLRPTGLLTTMYGGFTKSGIAPATTQSRECKTWERCQRRADIDKSTTAGRDLIHCTKIGQPQQRRRRTRRQSRSGTSTMEWSYEGRTAWRRFQEYWTQWRVHRRYISFNFLYCTLAPAHLHSIHCILPLKKSSEVTVVPIAQKLCPATLVFFSYLPSLTIDRQSLRLPQGLAHQLAVLPRPTGLTPLH